MVDWDHRSPILTDRWAQPTTALSRGTTPIIKTVSACYQLVHQKLPLQTQRIKQRNRKSGELTKRYTEEKHHKKTDMKSDSGKGRCLERQRWKDGGRRETERGCHRCRYLKGWIKRCFT